MMSNNERYTLEEAAAILAKETGEKESKLFSKLDEAVMAGSLPAYPMGSKLKINCGTTFADRRSRMPRGYKEYVLGHGLDKWLDDNEKEIRFRFLKPGTANEKLIPVQRQQDNIILNWLKENKYDPLKLPVPLSGKAGVKKLCREAVLFSSPSVFKTAWDRLRANGKIKDAK